MQEVSGVYHVYRHLSVFKYRLTKNAFAGQKSFRGFRETGPWNREIVGNLPWFYSNQWWRARSDVVMIFPIFLSLFAIIQINSARLCSEILVELQTSLVQAEDIFKVANSCPQRLHSFWSAPRIATSARLGKYLVYPLS